MPLVARRGQTHKVNGIEIEENAYECPIPIRRHLHNT